MAKLIGVTPAPAPPPPPEAMYQLELSESEVRMLVEVLRRVGGDPATTWRRKADAVLGVLQAAGLTDDHLPHERIAGAVYFK